MGITDITRKKKQREEKRIIDGLKMKTEVLERKNIGKDNLIVRVLAQEEANRFLFSLNTNDTEA